MPGHGCGAAGPPRRSKRQDRRRGDRAGHPALPDIGLSVQGGGAGPDAHRAQQAQVVFGAGSVGGHGSVEGGGGLRRESECRDVRTADIDRYRGRSAAAAAAAARCGY